MYKLIIQDDEGKTTVVPLIRDEVTIGRKEGNTIRLTERNISRQHARIVRQNGHVVVEDLESYNGIRINGQRIEARTEIRESDRIQIGDYLLEVREEGAAAKDPFSEQSTDPLPRQQAALAVSAADASAEPAREPSAPGVTPLPVDDAAQASTDPAVARSARLVVMSANFAGQEFPLDKPAVVIGRTEDNDVVVDHRSISRHHAKVVRERDRFAVVDLASSNGVRVNGEEYGKVELRPGDLIDLGHVRFRFVEAGEDFVFERDAQVVDLGAAATGGRGNMAKFAGGFVLTAAVIAALLLFFSGDDDPAPVSGVVPAPELDAGPGRTAVAPVPVAAPGPDAPEANDGGRHVAEARLAVTEERWDDASVAAKAALVADPENEEAGRLAQTAGRESRAAEAFAAFQQAATTDDIGAVQASMDRIPQDSVYHGRAAPLFESMRERWVQDQLAVAEDLAAEGKCKQLERHVKKAVRTVPAARTALAKVADGCSERDEPATPRRPDERRPPRPTPAAPEPDRPAPRPEAPEGDFDALFEEARGAFAANQDAKALAKAEAALGVKPGDQNALSIAAYAACRLKRADVARRYYERLRGQRQQNVKSGCAQVGVFFQ